MATSRVVSGLILVLAISSLCNYGESLQSNYYQTRCPNAESTIANVVANAIRSDKRNGASMIRLFFHDCFVQGCDASILIDSPTNSSEKFAPPNLSLNALELIDQAKAAVEAICPKTVSCADVVAFAATTSLCQLGGPILDIQGGRFDGLVSSISEVIPNIPSPNDTVSTLQAHFSSKGLNNQDLVALSGAHTIGKAHCKAFSNRLRNFSQVSDVDPALNVELASSLQQQCPVNHPATTIVNNDVLTPTFFDNGYHRDLLNNNGLFSSDAQLLTSPTTLQFVNDYAGNNVDFLRQFAASLFKMGQIGLKTSVNGNIRTNCRSFT